jgi:hypothetical protein
MPFGLGFTEAILLGTVLSTFLLWMWALAECLLREESVGNTRVVWALVILLAPFFGALLYLVVRRPERIRELGR